MKVCMIEVFLFTYQEREGERFGGWWKLFFAYFVMLCFVTCNTLVHTIIIFYVMLFCAVVDF